MPSVPSDAVPQGGLGDDLLRTNTWGYVVTVAAIDGCTGPNAAETVITVTQEQDSAGVWKEQWVVAWWPAMEARACLLMLSLRPTPPQVAQISKLPWRNNFFRPSHPVSRRVSPSTGDFFDGSVFCYMKSPKNLNNF